MPNPSGNRVYAGAAAALAAAEIAITVPDVEPDSIRSERVGGLDQVAFRAPIDSAALASLSSRFLLCARNPDGSLRPMELPDMSVLDDDLVTIPKYPGKTNEQFTRLMLNLALATLSPLSTGARAKPYEVLDPLCGRGTTTSCAWLLGHHGYGVESDAKAIEAHAAFLTTWLRRKRLKHKVAMTPVRREGRSLGRRLDATVTGANGPLELGIMTGDARDSAILWGKRRFDAVITDAPYGIVHGSRTDDSSRRSRSAAELLREAVPVWASQLRTPGVLAIAWNTLGLAREDLLSIMADAGLEPRDDGPWRQLAHKVDSSIHRDVVVAARV